MGLLRFWLAGAVALWHIGPGFIQPWLYPSLAVSAFYVVSGFYMQLLVTERHGAGRGWVAGFYASRVLRLFPIYFVFLAASIACLAWSPIFSYEKSLATLVLTKGTFGTIAYYFLSNIFIFGQEVGRFGVFDQTSGSIFFVSNPLDYAPDIRASSMPVMGQSWTIALELWFYLLVPVVLVRRTAAVAGLVGLALLLRIGIHIAGIVDQSWWNSFFPTELGVFLAGSLACRIYLSLYAAQRVTLRHRCLAGAVYGLVFLYSIYYLAFQRWSVWIPYAAFVVIVVLILPILFHVTRRSRFDRIVGDLSYPIYLSHLVVGAVYKGLGISAYYEGTVTLATCVMLGLLLVRYVDRPIAKLRHRLSFSRNDRRSELVEMEAQQPG